MKTKTSSVSLATLLGLTFFLACFQTFAGNTRGGGDLPGGRTYTGNTAIDCGEFWPGSGGSSWLLHFASAPGMSQNVSATSQNVRRADASRWLSSNPILKTLISES